MASLQQITDTWGNWIASQHGTSCNFTASTNYSAHGELNQYGEYQCTATYQSISYHNIINTNPTMGSDVAYELWYDNGTSVQQSEVFEYTYTSTQEFTWSITESLSIGVQVSATVGIPDLVDIKTQDTVTLSLSSTQQQSTSQTKSWTVNTTVAVPPESSVQCDVIVQTQLSNLNFTATVNLLGFVAIWFKDQVALGAPGDLHWLWFIPITSVFSDVVSHNLGDISGYQISGNGILASTTGVFTSNQAIYVGVQNSQYPLRTAAPNSASSAQTTKRLYPEAVAGK